MPSPTAPAPDEAPVPRRDWFLLPLISLLTICFMALSTEMFARWMFPKAKLNVPDCWVTNDRSTGVRGIPNSDCWSGQDDRPPVEFKFNSCGHDTGMECEAKKPGTYRIVMVGSSVALGLGVQREKTFAASLPEELSRESGRKV